MAELVPRGLQGLCPAGRCDSILLWGWHPTHTLGSSCSGGVTHRQGQVCLQDTSPRVALVPM